MRPVGSRRWGEAERIRKEVMYLRELGLEVHAFPGAINKEASLDLVIVQSFTTRFCPPKFFFPLLFLPSFVPPGTVTLL